MQTLQNHFLLAMPSLTDAYFERSLVYLCEHSSEGAMGLVVNIPVDMSLDAMLTENQRACTVIHQEVVRLMRIGKVVSSSARLAGMPFTGKAPETAGLATEGSQRGTPR